MIPRPNPISSRFEAAVDTQKFFQMGWNLIESEDAGTRQYVITKLGAETGLAIIKTLTDIMDANQKDETTVSIFRDRTLPFYRIISHPDVLSSLILETPVDTIYTFLFGPSGRRGLQVFRSTATALSGSLYRCHIIKSRSSRQADRDQPECPSHRRLYRYCRDNLCLHSREFHGTECTTEPHSNQTSSQHRLFVASRTNPINSAKSPICSFRVGSRLARKSFQQGRSTR
jgi:hypothetical protein